MSGLTVDAGCCVGCGLCVRSCGNGGIELVGEGRGRVARVTGSCTLCASCVDACPVGALSIERGPAGGDVDEGRGFWVYCQVDADGAPLPVAFELLGRARELADVRGVEVAALLPSGPEGARALVSAGADEVLCCPEERLSMVSPDAAAHAAWACELVRARRERAAGPEALLLGATAFGRELAPMVAARLGCGLTADCTVLDVDAATGLLEQTRPAFGGNLMATIACPAARPQMATVRPGVFAAPAPDASRAGSVEVTGLPADLPARRVRRLSLERAAADTVADAEVLVVAGRGIGSKANLAHARRLAELLGGKLGCTRPLVEAGWLESWRQVGQTGVSVAPRLLIALGVSGAVQHLAGIGGAEVVVAVNEDAAAPIFGVARYRVQGDCVEVARELADRLEAREAAR